LAAAAFFSFCRCFLFRLFAFFPPATAAPVPPPEAAFFDNNAVDAAFFGPNARVVVDNFDAPLPLSATLGRATILFLDVPHAVHLD
jgi:hypothetical protein|tara:strand:+ start:276 stop:533 length:258 start_codon:yes stop_codon:yes gene_type:complete